TGDLGFLHDEELYFAGRFKDLIIIRGNNYYPQDIELSIESSHQAIRSTCSASFSIELQETEQLVIVAEVDRHYDNYSEVITAIRNQVANDYDLAVYAVLLVKTGTIPKTSSGKIQRHACRTQFLENKLRVIADSYLEIGVTSQKNREILSDRIVLSEPNSVQKWIEQWLIVELKLSATAIVSDKTFAEYGLDSVSVAELGAALEIEIDHVIKIDTDLFRDYPTINAFVKHLSNLINPESSESDLPDPALARLAIYDQIPQILRRVTKQQNRQVFIDDRWICDFASCNYLGLDLHPQVHKAIASAVNTWGSHPSWTRAVASPDLYHELEQKLAKLANAFSVRVFPSTTLLHMGVIPVLAEKEGIIFIDNATHRSVAEACRLAQQNGATVIHYRHNDLDDLSYKLERHAKARIKIIAIDGVYSMSANYPDLPSYVNLARKFDATIYVDDAHGFGIVGENPTREMPYGQKGNGIVNYFGLDYTKDRIIYCAALSKAFSSYAAFVTCGDSQMKKMLSTSWTGVFSGPLPVPSLATAVAGLEVNCNEGDVIRQRIYQYTRKLVTAAREIGLEVDNQNYFPIVSIVVGSVESVILACKILWEHGILITPGIYPAVPEHRNLLRFSITAANTDTEIERAIVALRDIHAQRQNSQCNHRVIAC
ncbi:MAG: aminotransferase class I/II-fold pyridoxal phosphate-dependent enzyme, partial [Microcystis aeruginosa]